jgi:anti-anti-sigma regulatory factor
MQQFGPSPAIVVEVQSSLDSSNCQFLVEQAREVYRIGSTKIILDLQHTDTLSSVGLQALQAIVLLFREKTTPTEVSSPFVLIRNPQPHIAQALLLLGFGEYAEIQRSA